MFSRALTGLFEGKQETFLARSSERNEVCDFFFQEHEPVKELEESNSNDDKEIN